MTPLRQVETALAEIEPADSDFLDLARQRQNRLTKPPGSLGMLEEVANRICAMRRTLEPSIQRPMIFVFAADHGVCEEGVNAYPQSVTRQMLANFLAGGAAINAIAESIGAELTLVDVGVLGPELESRRLITNRIGPGTANFCRAAAMSKDEAIRSILVGMECAEHALQHGSTLLAVGEMGIGNTTAASALCACITGAEPEAVCGRGTGCDDGGLERKKGAVKRALVLHRASVATPLETLASLGGFEIGAMCGVCIAAARMRVPVLIDGFISSAAAALAVWMNPAIRDYLIAAHESAEPGHRLFLDYLQLAPLLHLGMRLGEGTGAALVVPLVRGAVAALRFMATFESAGVSDSSIR